MVRTLLEFNFCKIGCILRAIKIERHILKADIGVVIGVILHSDAEMFIGLLNKIFPFLLLFIISAHIV